MSKKKTTKKQKQPQTLNLIEWATMLANTAAMAQAEGFEVQVGTMPIEGKNGLVVWVPGFALDDDGQVIAV